MNKPLVVYLSLLLLHTKWLSTPAFFCSFFCLSFLHMFVSKLWLLKSEFRLVNWLQITPLQKALICQDSSESKDQIFWGGHKIWKKKIPQFFKLLSDVTLKWMIFSKFCGLLTMSELYSSGYKMKNKVSCTKPSKGTYINDVRF